MSNSIYLLRHAETKVDLSTPAHKWSITPNGKQKAKELASTEAFGLIEGIVHSSEKKARQTADAFAEGLNVQMYELSGLDELKREHEGKLTEEEYRARVRDTLQNMDENVIGWESGAAALRRFESAVNKVNIMFHQKNILVVSHGIVLTAYFCKLKNFQSIAFERWSQLKFLSWGLIRDGRLLIDIV
ncbi:MAG: histidine phosphatase family protein [Candidatus Thorarchaeota archaeon]|jgi:broad specificity phosphatase PhoE